MDLSALRRWLFLGGLVTVAANLFGAFATKQTIGAMGAVSPFALAVRGMELSLIPYYDLVSFPVTIAIVVVYLWPVIAYAAAGEPEGPSLVVQRRIVGAPAAIAALGFAPWLLSCILFPSLTIIRFGRWSGELISQQVFSPLVSGFLAAATSYLVLDWMFRARIVPLVFPAGRVAEMSGAITPGVRTRMFVFLLAVAFAPLFTMLGLIRSAVARMQAGVPMESVIHVIAAAANVTFVVYVALGLALTVLLGATLTRPLMAMAAALRRVRRGDLDVHLEVGSGDEVGTLQDGVNALVDTLREREHILSTFGRIVDPSIRDQLLSGELRLEGELRTASVLFCDLRGFTALAERTAPTEVVATLNQFFTVMTTWVRECNGLVDKFIGDAILVVFGLFEDSAATGAADAVRCGMGMREKLAQLNAGRVGRGQAALAVAVSVHTGEVLAGRIGAEDRHEYTVIGDTVNVASRLQQACKEQGLDLMISQITHDLARAGGVLAPIASEDLVALRGRSEPVRAFGVG